MPITASQIVDDALQADGRRWIRERHTDQLGATHDRLFLVAAGYDAPGGLAAGAAAVLASLDAAEVATNIANVQQDGSLASISLLFSSVAENRVALRAAYLTATRVQAVMIGDFLASLSDAQLQSLFGLTAGQVTTLRANFLTPAASNAAAVRAATGT